MCVIRGIDVKLFVKVYMVKVNFFFFDYVLFEVKVNFFVCFFVGC